jgi:hypothetical protein
MESEHSIGHPQKDTLKGLMPLAFRVFFLILRPVPITMHLPLGKRRQAEVYPISLCPPYVPATLATFLYVSLAILVTDW